MRDRHQNNAAAAAQTPRREEEEEDPAATAPMVLQLEEGDGGGDSKTATATAAAEDAIGSLQGEDLKLEVQVQSQFRLLWAVFQSHSTAEDEVIWPALKEKARSSGGKVPPYGCLFDGLAPCATTGGAGGRVHALQGFHAGVGGGCLFFRCCGFMRPGLFLSLTVWVFGGWVVQLCVSWLPTI